MKHRPVPKSPREAAQGLFYTPAEAGKLYAENYQQIANREGLTFGFPGIDDRMLPMRPGDWVGFMGRPGHGKTTMMAAAAVYNARRILEAGRQDTDCVVFCGIEPSIEEMEVMFNAAPGYDVTSYMKGALRYEDVLRQSLQRVRLPIYQIGKSVLSGRANTPRLTADNIFLALEGMHELLGVKPVIVFLDYIQILPIDKADSRADEVTQAANLAAELAKEIRVPFVMGVQASRAVDARGTDDRFPQLQDCQHSSGIEQVADKLYSLWRPWLTSPGNRNKQYDVNGEIYYNSPHLMLVRNQKERMNEPGYTAAMRLDPGLVRLSDAEPGERVD